MSTGETVAVPLAVFSYRLSGTAFRIYGYLLAVANDGLTPEISLSKLAALVERDEKNVRLALRDLSMVRLVERTKGHGRGHDGSAYRVELAPPAMGNMKWAKTPTSTNYEVGKNTHFIQNAAVEVGKNTHFNNGTAAASNPAPEPKVEVLAAMKRAKTPTSSAAAAGAISPSDSPLALTGVSDINLQAGTNPVIANTGIALAIPVSHAPAAPASARGTPANSARTRESKRTTGRKEAEPKPKRKPPAGHPKVTAVCDAFLAVGEAVGKTVDLSGRDAGELTKCTAEPADIVQAYLDMRDGRWKPTWKAAPLALYWVAQNMNEWRQQRADTGQHPGRYVRGHDRQAAGNGAAPLAPPNGERPRYDPGAKVAPGKYTGVGRRG